MDQIFICTCEIDRKTAIIAINMQKIPKQLRVFLRSLIDRIVENTVKYIDTGQLKQKMFKKGSNSPYITKLSQTFHVLHELH